MRLHAMVINIRFIMSEFCQEFTKGNLIVSLLQYLAKVGNVAQRNSSNIVQLSQRCQNDSLLTKQKPPTHQLQPTDLALDPLDPRPPALCPQFNHKLLRTNKEKYERQENIKQECLFKLILIITALKLRGIIFDLFQWRMGKYSYVYYEDACWFLGVPFGHKGESLIAEARENGENYCEQN